MPVVSQADARLPLQRERGKPVWKHKEVVGVTLVVSVFNQRRDSFEEPRDSEVNWPPPEGRDNVMRDRSRPRAGAPSPRQSHN